MSDFLNLQAALGQTSILSGLGGASARGMSCDGGFGAVLGAVMADSMGGFETADISVGVNAGGSRADGAVGADNADGNVKACDDVVSEGVAAAELEADNAAKALAELYGALCSVEDPDGELPDVMFTAEGAKAFISVLERYISQGNIPSRKDIEELWKGVSADEKNAYADILGAIALGSVVLPDENAEAVEVSSEDVLGFVVREAGKLCLRPAASRKSDKDEQEAASYIMSVFIAPSFSVNMDNDSAAIASEGLANAVSGEMSLAAGETVGAVQTGDENIPRADDSDGENAGAVSTADAVSMDSAEAADGAVGANSTVSLSGLGEAIAERIFDADPDYAEELEKFCGVLAAELKAEAAKDTENAGIAAATPEDIGRQAFMARVSAPVHETKVAGVEAALRQNAVGDVRVSEDVTGESEALVTNAEDDSISDNMSGRISPEDDKNADINASRNVVRNAAQSAQAAQLAQLAQGSRVFETTEETAYAEDVPVSPADTGEIARRISEYISKGRNESITLRLDPEDLGEIKVTVTRKAGETIVAFEAHKSESAQLIGDRVAALAEALAAKGIAVREISVTDMNSGNGNGSAKNGGEFYGGNRQADTDGGSGADNNASGNGYSRHYYFEEPEEATTADENYYYNKEADLWLKA